MFCTYKHHTRKMDHKLIKVSVIIPVYNVENYLDRCLKSVLDQTEKNIEILCIDDCSTDNSLNILKNYAKTDERLHIFYNQHNYGQAYSRNIGLDAAKGEYIIFVDSDDYIDNRAIEEMYDTAIKRNLDLLFCDAKIIREYKETQTTSLRRFRKAVYTDESGAVLFHHMVQQQDMFGNVWGVLYRTAFLKENQLRFIKGILHEDVPFIFKATILSRNAGCVNNTYYYYVERNNSTMRSDNIEQRLEGMLIAYFDMLIFWREHGDYTDEINQSIHNHIENYHKFMISLYSQTGREKIKNPMVRYVLQTGMLEKTDTEIEISDTELAVLRGHQNGIVIYGAGKIARKVFEWLSKNNINVDAFVVTDLKNNDTEINKIPVIDKDDLLKSWKNALIVMGVSKQNRDEIYKELILNVNKKRIVDIKR